VNLAFAIGLMALLGIAALSDLRHRRIPNEIPASAALLWLVALALGAAGSPLAGLATGLGLLAAGILAWRLGWLGGGDVKLIAALGLWAGPGQLPVLLLGIALAGGVLALVACFVARLAAWPPITYAIAAASRFLPALSPSMATAWHQRGLPYGLAIACGGAWLVHRLVLA
jgi:prepilin peptidase CpaA